MTRAKDLTIKLSQLQLDPENPRHEPLSSQAEILEWMASSSGDIGNKIYTLARDICEHGVNPADRMIVVQSPSDRSMYITLEGNRRLTALKFLNNPASAPDTWQSKYAKLAREAEATIPKEIDCVVYPNKESAYHFVELKHLGQNKGAGTVDWGAKEKVRHESRTGKKTRSSRSINLLEHIASSDAYSEEVKSAAENVNITTLDRLLSNKDFRAFMGVEDDADGGLSYRTVPSEARKAISKVILDFGNKIKKVGDVIDKNKIIDYRNSFAGKDKPDHSKRLETPLKVSSKRAADLLKKKPTAKKPRLVDQKKRKYLPYTGQTMTIDGSTFPRPRHIFDELKTLQIDHPSGKSQSHINAAAVLFRSFLEMSTVAYLEAMNITPNNPAGWQEVKLVEKVRVAAKDLVKNGCLDKRKEGNIARALSGKDGAAHTNQLNNYVHNPYETVDERKLKTAWEVYSPLLESVWASIYEKQK